MIATRPVDFRHGHDGLAAYAQMALGLSPTQGLFLIFRARRGDRLKILYWDSNGIVRTYKRLEAGNFVWATPGDAVMGLARLQFQGTVVRSRQAPDCSAKRLSATCAGVILT